MAEPKNAEPPRLRDWPMFRAKCRNRHDGRAPPKIGELIVAQVPGTAAEKLAWFRCQKAEGRLDGEDPEEVAQAEALLAMLVRMSGGDRAAQRLDALLDEGLKQTFPASDPVSVGHFTATEPSGAPAENGLPAAAKPKPRTPPRPRAA